MILEVMKTARGLKLGSIECQTSDTLSATSTASARTGKILEETTIGKFDVIPIYYPLVIIMKELKQVYGRFESVHFNRGR